MRPYETLIVLSNELGDGQQALLERLHGVIQAGGGRIDASRDWGNRRLAYPIRRQSDGHYYLIEYQAEPPVVQELERTLRISDGVLRYLSVQQEHTGLPEPKAATPRREREDVPLSELRSAAPQPAAQAGEASAESREPAEAGAAAPSGGGGEASAPEGAATETGGDALAGADAETDTGGDALASEGTETKTDGGEQS